MSEKKLLIIEQIYWFISAVLLMASTVVSFVTKDMMYLVVCLLILIAVMCIGMIVFGILFERLMEEEEES